MNESEIIKLREENEKLRADNEKLVDALTEARSDYFKASNVLGAARREIIMCKMQISDLSESNKNYKWKLSLIEKNPVTGPMYRLFSVTKAKITLVKRDSEKMEKLNGNPFGKLLIKTYKTSVNTLRSMEEKWLQK